MLEIARRHPEYSYRRTTAELRERGFSVNHKIIERLHTSWDLSVIKRVKPHKPNPIRTFLKEAGSRINLVAKLQEIDDLEVFYTDFTELRYRRGLAKTH